MAPRTLGVIEAHTRRVVITASVEEPVVIYVEKYGDERMLHVDVPTELRTAVVRHVESDEQQFPDPARPGPSAKGTPPQGGRV